MSGAKSVARGVVRVIGLDPGLRHTGWGIIDAFGGRLRYVADGVISPPPKQALAARLGDLHHGLAEVLAEWTPDEAAVEATFVNENPRSALKLGQARGVVLLAPVLAGITVAEYEPTLVKQSVVGTGRASKEQVEAMVRRLLPGALARRSDASDSLAIAVCHVNNRSTRQIWSEAAQRGSPDLR